MQALPRVRDGWTFLYVEHAKVERENNAIVFVNESGATSLWMLVGSSWSDVESARTGHLAPYPSMTDPLQPRFDARRSFFDTAARYFTVLRRGSLGLQAGEEAPSPCFRS
jgi:hypothetical protein